MFDPFIDDYIVEEIIEEEVVFGRPGFGYGYGYADPFLAVEEAIIAEEIVDDFLGF